MVSVDIKSNLLSWARERAGKDLYSLKRSFPKLADWESGCVKPTLKQIERFAKATHTPVGYFFLEEPPVEKIPIPDFRTVQNEFTARPSPNLLDTIYVCQQRQEWYHDYALSMGEEPLSFVGTASVKDDVVMTAAKMRQFIGFDIDERKRMPTWADALRKFIDQVDAIGIMVMCSGVVMNNNYRHLNPEEFRGFAMADPLAPLVFINGADTKAAQMFTLAHEIAHIWLGLSAVSDVQASWISNHRVERWCNRVAAEFLVPLDLIKHDFQKNADLFDELNRLARRFKVSTLVVLRRIYDADGIAFNKFQQVYQMELERLINIVAKGGGGNFYLTQAARVSKRFARALIANTLEGQTLHRDAFRMLGFSKLTTFRELGQSLGVF
ncbi:MAG: DNA-binding protein [Deltaproteobacteria bacterium HGW-Deltaproteobacteria-12]|nr:MAG: DNA-binding protein [Deltaproteobacteria bacterium HGW-Deltaproteobacteria-12]